MKRIVTIFLILFALPAFCQEQEVDCDSTCPSGEKMVAFADGNKGSCRCVKAAQMDPTVPDPDLEEDYPEDEENS